MIPMLCTIRRAFSPVDIHFFSCLVLQKRGENDNMGEGPSIHASILELFIISLVHVFMCSWPFFVLLQVMSNRERMVQ